MNEDDILSQAIQVLSEKDGHDKALLQRIIGLAQEYARLTISERGLSVICYPFQQGKIYALPCKMDKGGQVALLFLEQAGELLHLKPQQIITMPQEEE